MQRTLDWLIAPPPDQSSDSMGAWGLVNAGFDTGDPFAQSFIPSIGSISKVEFYEGINLLGTDISSPFSFDWTNVFIAGGFLSGLMEYQYDPELYKDSDIDIIVITKSDKRNLIREIRFIGYELEIEFSVVLSIQVLTEEYINYLRSLPTQFIQNVDRDAIAI
jgi:hypothetical protein